jgi:hypothetical protein
VQGSGHVQILNAGLDLYMTKTGASLKAPPHAFLRDGVSLSSRCKAPRPSG